jgi:hypothetical protein
LVTWFKAPNSDDLLRELALISKSAFQSLIRSSS